MTVPVTDQHGNPVTRLANGRLVTRGTAWAVEHWSGRRDVDPGILLVCVHGVALAKRCEACT